MKRLGLSILMLAILLSFCSCSIFPKEQSFDTYMTINEDDVQYEYVYAVRGTIAHTEKIVCSYMPAAKEEYSFSINGESFNGIYVKYGEKVKKGDLLAELYTEEFVDEADEISLKISTLENSIKILEEEKTLAIWEYKVKSETMSDIEKMLIENEDEIKRRYENEIKENESQLEIMKIQLETLNKEIDERCIYAGMDGVVSYVKTITSSSKSVAYSKVVSVSDNSEVFFMAKTKYYENLKKGDIYTISLDKGEYNLEVCNPDELGISASEGYVYFTIQGNPTELTESDKGTIYITLEKKENVIYLPEDAVTQLDDKAVCFFLNADGIRDYKEVITGFTSGGYVEIIEGVEEGEKIIVG